MLLLADNLPEWRNGIRERLKIVWEQSRVGSSPTSGTRIELKGFEETAEWAAQSAAHAVCPDFAGGFGKFGALARTVLFWRRRCEPKISLAQTFLAKRSESEAILSKD